MATSSAADIVQALGGPSNVQSLTHCATRLRFQLVDASVVDQKKVDAIPVVMGSVPQAGNRFQVVIGGAVQNVYNEITALPEMSGMGSKQLSDDEIKAAARAARGKYAWIDSFFEFLGDSFRPILGTLLGASLFITLMSLLATTGVIGNWADPRTNLPTNWAFVNLLWQSVFVFLPLMVAYNASKKVGADPWVGFSIMALLMLPGFTKLASTVQPEQIFGASVSVVHIWGIPLAIRDYSSQVFPPLLMAAVLGPLYKWLKKVIPSHVQLIFVPFIAMVIMLPLTAFLIGPIGVYAGAGIASVLKAVNDFSPFIFAIIVPLAYPFMVPLGLHWPINAIMLLNIQTLGYDFIQGPMGSWNFACFGATAGVLFLSWRDKDYTMRQTATGALAAGLLGGISEPSLYGIHLRYKRIYPRMLVGCLVGGVITGIGGGVSTKAFAFTSLLTIPVFHGTLHYVIAIAAAFFTAMTLVIISDYRTPEQRAEFLAQRDQAEADLALEAELAAAAASPAAKLPKPAMVPGTVTAIPAPLAGRVMPLAEVPDPVFAKGTVGRGVGIEPSGDTVYAPADGKVIVAPDTGHAIGLQLDSGVELLIHIGIDTVGLEGKGFEVFVKRGDVIEAGTKLVTFDRAVIEAAGLSLVTPVLVTNSKKFGAVEQTSGPETKVGEPLLAVTAKEAATAPVLANA